jgi:ATP-dependent protease ClpP protease subunit
MVGNVHIIGQIGNSYNEDGTILEKGVELVDVVSQVEPLKECETINVWINSGGGLVSVGDEIAEYLSSKKNVVTIADEFCASIATKIHLSVPKENRKVVAGTKYMIHNPLFSEITNANADDLKAAAAVLEPIQKGLVSMYVKSTGTSKQAIQALMNLESSLTEDQLMDLGFVSEIINKVQLKAVAFIDKSAIKTKTDNMSNVKLSLVQKAMAKMKGREVKAIIEDVEQGAIETPFSDIMVGDPIMLGTEPAPADTYVLADGTQIVVTEPGLIGEIIPAEVTPVENKELLDKIAELEAENSTLKATAEEREGVIAEMEREHTEVLAIVDQYKAKEGSRYTPPAENKFGKQTRGGEKTREQILAERRSEIKGGK